MFILALSELNAQEAVIENERNVNDTLGVTQVSAQQDSLLKAQIPQDSLSTTQIQQEKDKLRKVKEENADLESKKEHEVLIQAQLEAQIKERARLYKELEKQEKKRKKLENKLKDQYSKHAKLKNEKTTDLQTGVPMSAPNTVAPQDTVPVKNIQQKTVPQLQFSNPNDNNLLPSQIATLNRIRESLTPKNDGSFVLSGNLIVGNNNVIILMDNKTDIDEILSSVQRTKEFQSAQHRNIKADIKDNDANENANIAKISAIDNGRDFYTPINERKYKDNQIGRVKKIFTESLLDHTSLGIKASTMGIGLELSTTLSRNLQFRTGYDFADYNRNFYLKTKDRNLQTAVGLSTFPTLKTNVNFFYRNGHALIDIYPIRKGIFHFTAGIYYGLSKIYIDGQVVHPETKNPLPLVSGQKWPDLNFANYVVAVNDGKVKSEMTLGNRWKPYFGIGLGRSIPKTRLGFKIELGALYQGDFVMRQNGKKLVKDKTGQDSFINTFNYTRWMSLYPMVSLQLIYRIW
jgi:hypothetical protein